MNTTAQPLTLTGPRHRTYSGILDWLSTVDHKKIGLMYFWFAFFMGIVGGFLAGAVMPREFDIQRVNGLPPQTVNPPGPEVLARIQRDTALKRAAFASEAQQRGWLDGFIMPLEGTVTGRWGNQRVLNGVPASPHFGYDIAAPAGTSTVTSPSAPGVTWRL